MAFLKDRKPPKPDNVSMKVHPYIEPLYWTPSQQYQVATHLGTILMVNKNTPYPSTWRMLFLEEALEVKSELETLIYEWGIVGL